MASTDGSEGTTIHLFGGIKPFKPVNLETKTVEDVIMECLLHLENECTKETDEEEKWELALYLPVFGLVIYPKESVWLPHWAMFPISQKQEFRLRVRFRPPVQSFKADNFMSHYLYVQMVIDFLENRNRMAELCELRQLYRIYSMILFIPHDLPLDGTKPINMDNYRTPNLNMLNLKKRMRSKAIFNKLTEQSPIIDRYLVSKLLKSKFEEYKEKNWQLSCFQERIYEMVLKNCPRYCSEVYQTVVEETHDLRVVNKGEIVSARMEMASDKGGNSGLYFDEKIIFFLWEIELLKIEVSMNEEDKKWKVAIINRADGPLLMQYLKLGFDAKEKAESFISMIQGCLRLSQHYNLILLEELEKNSYINSAKDLRSYGPLRRTTAEEVLIKVNWEKEPSKKHLIHQNPYKLNWFNVLAVEGCAQERTTEGVRTLAELEIECTGFRRYKLHGAAGENGPQEMDLESLKREMFQRFGPQLLPRQCPKDANIAEINAIYAPGGRSPEPGDNQYEYVSSPGEEDCPLYTSGDFEDRRPEINDSNPQIRKFTLIKKGNQKGKMMLVKVLDKHLIEHFRTGVATLHKLWRCDPRKFLKVYGSPLDLPDSMIVEHPVSDLLTHVAYRPTGIKDVINFSYQIVNILETMDKESTFHGNLRCRKFMVFEQGDIKLADPGIGYYMDTLLPDDAFNIERWFWLAPERRKNLGLHNYETECFAVGTTLYELLMRTDKFPKSNKKEREERGILLTDEELSCHRINPLPRPPQLDDPEVTFEAKELVRRLWAIILRCWNESPNERPMAEVLKREIRELSVEAGDLKEESTNKAWENIQLEFHRQAPQSSKPSQDEVRSFLEDNKDALIDNKAITYGERIGSGHFGQVFKGTVTKPSLLAGSIPEVQVVAIKVLKNVSPVNNHEFFKELRMARAMRHENIVRLLYFSYNPSVASSLNTLVMEYMDLGSLKEFVAKKPVLPMKVQLKISMDIVKGMCYLSGKYAVHRDLSARNVLVTGSRDHPLAKVSDMGLARKTEEYSTLYRMKAKEVFNPNWMAPEYERYLDTKGDVWSFGVVLWEIFTNGKQPSDGYKEVLKHPLENPSESLRDEKNRLPQSFRGVEIPLEVYEVMKQCWRTDPKARPFFPDLQGIIQILDSSLNSEGNC